MNKLNKANLTLIILGSIFILTSLSFAQDTLTITTYYPSPYGSYREVRSTRMAIGDDYIQGSEYCWEGSCTETIDDEADLVVQGNVGIGTVQPEFRLTLDKGAAPADGGILAIGSFGSGTTLTTSGAGTRLIWYPKKTAFRAGYVDGTQWDDANIGNFSTAMGYNTTASGGRSTAMGTDTTAIGYSSTAMGGSTTASGDHSTAMGYNTTASGHQSTAMGNTTTASGANSTAMGYYTTASGDSSTAIGGKFLSVGAGANNAIVLGSGSDSNNKLVNNIASSLMVGFGSDIPTLFVGPSSGIGNTGRVGIGRTNPPRVLHVEGSTDANTHTAAFVNTGNYYGVALGSRGNDTFGSITARMFDSVAGTGAGIANLILQPTGGNVGIGTTLPGYLLHIYGETGVLREKIENYGSTSGHQASLELTTNKGLYKWVIYLKGDENKFKIYGAGADRLVIDSGGNVGIGTLSGGGDVYSNASGYLYNSSDQRFKKNIKIISNQIDVIESLKQLRGVYFNWNTDIANEVKGLDFDDQRQMGMIAQEVEKVIPEVVGTDNEGYKTLSYSRLVGFLIEVNKVQQEQIEELKIKIEALEK